MVRTLWMLCWMTSTFAQIKLPQYTRETLPNGAVLIMMPRKELPLITLRVTVRGGSESDPAEFSGLANITAAMLTRGTHNRSYELLNEQIDFLGGTLRSQADRQSISLQMEFLS